MRTPYLLRQYAESSFPFQEKKLKKEERVELFEELSWVDGSFTLAGGWD